MWSSQVSKGCSNISIASYKLAVIIGEAKELLNLFLGLRLRPLMNSCYFLRISTDTLCRYNIPKVIYGAQAKGTLWLLSTELVLLQLLQNPTKVLPIFWWGLAKDKDIIKVEHATDIEILCIGFHSLCVRTLQVCWLASNGITVYSYNPQQL